MNEMKFGSLPVQAAEGAILAHSISVGGKSWRKGRVISDADIAELETNGVAKIVVAKPGPDDLDENAAAERIASALATPEIEGRAASTGRVNLHAVVGGVVTVSSVHINALNRVDPAITLATLPDYAAVEPGQMVATVKIIPFAVPARLVEEARAQAMAARLISLHPFHQRKVGLIQTQLPTIKKSVLDKTVLRTAERLARSGSIIGDEVRVPHHADEVASAAARLAEHHDIVLIFGASAVADADDVIPAAIRQVGRVERVGMPVDPGNLLVLGEIRDKPVIGAPGCARSPKLNGFDWVLNRLLANLPVGDSEIAGLGVGGLLMEIESRPQPRDPKPAAKIDVGAVVLAAGRGERMGGPNKLLAHFDGVPLVRKVIERVLASKAKTCIAVVGHEAERIIDTIEDQAVRIVSNANYMTGLASSLKVGIANLPPDIAGAIIVLADMPQVETVDLDLLIRKFIDAGGRSVVRATHSGKRGNPVILPRYLFEAVARLEGDTGARHLVESSDIPVIDVELGNTASLDVDTPEALAHAGGILQG